MLDKKVVQTVTGPVPIDELGRCLMHEHLIWGAPGWWGDPKAYDRETVINKVIAEIETLKPYGVKTIVNASPGDCGRFEDMLREISERTGINIICVAGYYMQEFGCTGYFSFRMKYGNAPQEAYEMLLHEVTEGIGDSGIRCGLLKIATGKDEITPYENLFLEAVARVCMETGVKIITHTQDGTMAAEQAKRLICLGVRPQDIMIGHLNEIMNIGELISVFEQGVYGGFDRCGLQTYLNCPPEEWQMVAIGAMALAGYSDRIILSHDLSCVRMGRDYIWPQDIAEALKDWNYRHIFTYVLPELKKRGLPSDVVESFVEANPHRFLAG